MLRFLAEAAARYGHDGIVAEIALHGAGAELAAELVAYLRPRPPEEPPAPEDEDDAEGEDEDELADDDDKDEDEDELETEEDAR
jgi:predicted  nucleic acid-binding Zn-ribbon protein